VDNIAKVGDGVGVLEKGSSWQDKRPAIERIARMKKMGFLFGLISLHFS
jgi:hypothetical protein